ncbi:hypothetical protein K2173_006774 [Erythroxylum novogranatense]|uniref:Protein kinase domain-containing protein n=1 Tax=Erythroxylum novogranatense TaxID=1862640 RepID=A0AAV8SZB4_9ROSI|nr:hypothetical protein K2173_006774 [Erythroxylum novogranatense]
MKPLAVSSSRGPFLISVLFFIVHAISLISPVRSGDMEALLALKSSIDPSNSLPWPQGSDVCNWQGIKECFNGRVSKLVVEYLNLNGTIDGKSLNQLDQLRVLSFKGNTISGQIPDLSGLLSLKALFLNNNNLSGNFPYSVTGLHHLKVIILAQNHLSGPLPISLLNLTRLYFLSLENNNFSGKIPPLNQSSLRFFNVSNNQLSGQIPVTSALLGFNRRSFSGNTDLCGEQLQSSCKKKTQSGLTESPEQPKTPTLSSTKSKWVDILVAIVGGLLLIPASVAMLYCLCAKKIGKKQKSDTGEKRSKGSSVTPSGTATGDGTSQPGSGGNSGMSGNTGVIKQGGFSWDSEGLGTLVFLSEGDKHTSYTLEDLLKATAESLGRGTIGSTYQAVMESGLIVTVKRLNEATYPRVEEFTRHVELLGKLRHPNLVPLRAYFQAKEERLLVYDYLPNGSLFSLLHGTRTSGGAKPLHWTSCFKIAEDLATGLLHIHHSPGLSLTHGNLKSSNVLLGPDFESCLTDYGLTMFIDPDSQEEPTATSLFYRAPETRATPRLSTQPSDVYSFGVLILEILTGKTPFQDFVQEHNSDIPRWIRSVREEDAESGDDPPSSNESAEEKLGALINVAMVCVSLAPENRPSMREVLKMVREARAEAHVSSNSSDHSPGRWSDSVLSLPRQQEEHSSI